MPSLLSGLKHNPLLRVTAVSNMFDTGGSSGELRDKYGILPPGDVLKALLGLSEDEFVARKILLKRIEHKKFSGHTGGNLLLFALEKIYGDYYDAVNALGHILGARGRVIPVTITPSTLVANYKGGRVERGETAVDVGVFEGDEIESLSLDPAIDAAGHAVAAIEEADAFCIGPGSFYTSIMPNFLPRGIKEALAASDKPVIYICNLLTEGKGMKGYHVRTLVEKIEAAIGREVNAVLVNRALPGADVLAKYAAEEKYPLLLDGNGFGKREVVEADIWRDPAIARHDSAVLGHLVHGLLARLCVDAKLPEGELASHLL
jgi:uncharacterized cofD-like protein